MPKSMDNDAAMVVFTELQQAMGIEPKEPAVAEDWEIAPRLDSQGLREAYVNEDVFNVGETITHDSTGLIAEIVRKCTNYLICVTEDDRMFKAWTHDVSSCDALEETPRQTNLRGFLNRLPL